MLKPRKPTRQPVMCQPLEQRLLFITTTFDATNGNDTIVLSVNGSGIQCTINGATDTRSDVIFNDIAINGMNGDDTIVINSTGSNTVTVNAGDGADQIRFTANTNDLDNIDESVTVNGEGGSDTATLFDSNNNTFAVFNFTGGNVVGRTNVPSMTLNVQSVVIVSGTHTNHYLFQDVPNFNATLNGAAGTVNVPSIDGAAGEVASYRPSATIEGDGSIVFQSRTIQFTNADRVEMDDVALTFVTPNANDDIDITPLGSAQNRVTGTSGGVGMTDLLATNLTSLTLDLASNDGGGGGDFIDCVGTLQSSPVLNVNAGTGSNVLRVQGDYTIDTDHGASGGTNLNVLALGATTALTFSGAQAVRQLEIANGANVDFAGATGTVLATPDLYIAGGTATLDTGANQTVTCSAGGSFQIDANATLVKDGSGTLVIAASQNHAAGAMLFVEGGTLNMTTNAGSAAARHLSVHAAGATVNFTSTQHLNTISTGIGGTINLQPNGNRVLVCSDVFIESEGSAINLTNNDMIVDYSGATPLETIRLMLAGGHAGGNWNGIGINSSTAALPPKNTGLAYAEATDLFTTFPATFSGQPIDDTAILIKYTYYGDFNFDGQVNLTDFNRLASNFGQGSKHWIHGDNTYDRNVNLSDFNRLASSFGQTGLRPEAGGTTSGAGDETDRRLAELS